MWNWTPTDHLIWNQSLPDHFDLPDRSSPASLLTGVLEFGLELDSCLGVSVKRESICWKAACDPGFTASTSLLSILMFLRDLITSLTVEHLRQGEFDLVG